MAPMVNMRAVPAALRSATARAEHALRHSISAMQTRDMAANAAIREPECDVPPRTSALERRMAAVNQAKPFSDFLTDTFHRQHDYLRISITERCNLRCLYCMPEEGIPLSPDAHMLTTPEIFYLSSLFVSQGVTKIRLTGGEPTIRRDIVPLMQQIGGLRSNGLRELALTTNGIALHRKLDAMVESGLTGVNLSLDTLDPFQFQIMTRRNGFDAVTKSINRILEMNKLGANVKLKVNCVVMRGLNEREILPFVEMGRDKEIEVRFIEYMPFGGNKWSQGKMISFQEMLDTIRTKYPDLRPVPGHKNDTSKTYKVPGFVGKVGFITSMTNDFCGSCNRLRITSDGNLKVCLHGNAEVSLRDVLRQGNNGQPIDQEAFERIKQIEMDRHEGRLSDETILGWGQRERELLDVVGAAVKRKAEKHADMGDLENMTNRPMILIDRSRPIASSRLQRSALFGAPTSPVSPYSFLNLALSPSTLSVRSYHVDTTQPEFGKPRESLSIGAQEPSPSENKVPEQIYIKKATPMQKAQNLLRAVYEHGVENSVLPKNYAQIRKKYNMNDSIYDTYWRLAAGSQLTGDATVRHSGARARYELGRVKRELLACTKDNEVGSIPSHKNLMTEAKELGKTMRSAFKKMNEDIHGLVRDIDELSSKAVRVRSLQDPVRSFQDPVRSLEGPVRSLEGLVRIFQDPVRSWEGPKRILKGPVVRYDDSDPRARLTKRAKWRQNKKLAAKEAERDMAVEQIALKRAEFRRAKAVTAKIKRLTKLNQLERRSEELQRELETLRRLQAEQEANRIERAKRGQTLTQEEKEQSAHLSDVLDVAAAKFAAEYGPFAAAERRPRPETRTYPSFSAPLPSQERTPSDQLHLQVPASGEIVIDSDLTITLLARTATLRKQIVQMQDRIKASYPRIDTLSWDVSRSENRYSLQVWLKIMAGRWQKRHDNTEDPSDGDAEVLAILDQMVRDHDLTNASATRMAEKWKQIMRNRKSSSVNKDSPDVKMDDTVGSGWQFEQKSTPLATQNHEVVSEKQTSSGQHGSVTIEDPMRKRDRDSINSDGLKELMASVQPRKRIPFTKPISHTRRTSFKDSTATARVEPPSSSTFDNVDAHKIAAQPSKTKSITWSPGGIITTNISPTRRLYSTSSRPPLDPAVTPSLTNTPATSTTPTPTLPHLTPSGSAHMVSVSSKAYTVRTAIAVGTVYFSNPTPLSLIKSNSLKKGDVLSVSRIAGIMAAKKCPDLIPLCHPIALTHVAVELKLFSPLAPPSSSTPTLPEDTRKAQDDMGFGHVAVEARVSCTGPTGVEMEALTSVMGTALSVVDMCKAVDKFQRIGGVRVVLKEGGKSGVWREEGWVSLQE